MDYVTRSRGYRGQYPPTFKPVDGRYPRVIGGRWYVRKIIPSTPSSFTWRAWSTGKSGKYSFKFETWAEANWWAQFVAFCHSKNGVVDEEQMARTLMYMHRALRTNPRALQTMPQLSLDRKLY